MHYGSETLSLLLAGDLTFFTHLLSSVSYSHSSSTTRKNKECSIKLPAKKCNLRTLPTIVFQYPEILLQNGDTQHHIPDGIHRRQVPEKTHRLGALEH
jgi:hypothetical protein